MSQKEKSSRFAIAKRQVDNYQDGIITQEFEEISLSCLRQNNRLRRGFIRLVKWRWFERVVILVILVNCIMLAMYDPLDKNCQSRTCRVLEKLEKFVFAFFAIEMVIKMIAMGLIGSKSYFSDRWNILDFIIVVAGVVDLVGPRGDFITIVRVGRVLRPLRAINRVPSIRILVTLLMDTIPMLGNVLLLAFLVFSMFGIIGVQVWQGKLRNRCFLKLPNNLTAKHFNLSEMYSPSPTKSFLCSIPGDAGTQHCGEVPPTCGYNTKHVDPFAINRTENSSACLNWNLYYTSCEKRGPNPYYDSISFDNIALAWIFIYQVVTLEGWSDLMYLVQDASSFWSWIYFVTLITIGSFFLVNLSLVVITMQFSETKRREMKLIREQKRKQKTESQLSLVTDMKRIFYWFSNCLKCKRKRHVHHYHHHEHHHFHHHTFQCEKCKMFCGFQQSTQSPPELKSDPVIPTVEISCFDEDGRGEEDSSEQALPLRRNSVSCPDLPGDQGMSDGKIDGAMLRREDSAPAQNNAYLSPKQDSRKSSAASNTLSVYAESISSVSIDGHIGKRASVSSKTSISLHINGASAKLSTQASASSNAELNGASGNVKTSAFAEAKIESSLRERLSQRFSRNSTASSHCSEYRMDNLSDFADTSSEALYGSMFDLKNADKYYVSEEPSFFQRFRMYCKRISESRKFSHFIMFIIVINTVCMGLEHHNQPKLMTNVLESLNLVFIWIFSFEMFIKILGGGAKAYFRQGFNVFDCLIVLLSIVELLVDDRGGGSNFIVLRSLRLLRIFKLVRPMRHQMMVMIRTMSSVMTFFALLFLFMFTFAILGMNLFGGKFNFQDDPARSNFDTFMWAMVTVFQILTQEDWNLVMYNGIRATGKWSALYFLFLMTIGYYVLLNLLVAILVEGFTTPMEKKRMARRIAEMLLNKTTRSTMRSPFLKQRSHSLPDISVPTSPCIIQKSDLDNSLITPEMAVRGSRTSRRKTWGVYDFYSNVSPDLIGKREVSIPCLKEKPKPGQPVLLAARPRLSTSRAPEFYQPVTAWFSNITITSSNYSTANCRLNCSPCTSTKDDWSLFLLPPSNRLRNRLKAISSSKWFDYFILILILFSCVLLAMETPDLKPDSKKRKLIDTSMFVLTWIFTLEMAIKVLAFGFIIGEESYLKSGWNCLDGLLVLLSWIDILVTLVTSNTQTDIFKALRVLRAMRTLRPLRMIQRAPGLKLVVQTLLYSLKPIGNTVLIAAIFFVVFGILGVQLLKGKFFHCDGASYVRNKTECDENPFGTWDNYQYNFDNLPGALIALFVVSTKDGWVDIMWRGIDAVGVDQQPQTNYSTWRLLYFISFLLIGGFLVLNMIVGVVVENFQRCRELQKDEEKAKKVFTKWKECVDVKKSEYLQGEYYNRYSKTRYWIYKLCTHNYWDIGVTVLIMVNIMVMAMEHYDMSRDLDRFIEVSNIAFTLLYVIEAGLQLTAIGVSRYFKNKWYCFDMIIVVVSVLGIILEFVDLNNIGINPGVVRGMRMLRVVRVLKLLKFAKGLRFLLDHVAETIPQVTNLALLFFLLFFIYSCLGMQLFGTLECSPEKPCAGLGKHANFKSMGSSMLTLFRIATGDNWSGILKDTLRPGCDDSVECSKNCCLSTYTAPIFFVSFVLFAQFVLVNIVIAVLMKHLRVTNLCKKDERKKKKKKKDIKQQSEEEKEERNHQIFNKWHQKALQRMAKRDSESNEKTFVRTKRSTDDLDNVQLKVFRTRSENDITIRIDSCESKPDSFDEERLTMDNLDMNQNLDEPGLCMVGSINSFGSSFSISSMGKKRRRSILSLSKKDNEHFCKSFEDDSNDDEDYPLVNASRIENVLISSQPRNSIIINLPDEMLSSKEASVYESFENEDRVSEKMKEYAILSSSDESLYSAIEHLFEDQDDVTTPDISPQNTVVIARNDSSLSCYTIKGEEKKRVEKKTSLPVGKSKIERLKEIQMRGDTLLPDLKERSASATSTASDFCMNPVFDFPDDYDDFKYIKCNEEEAADTPLLSPSIIPLPYSPTDCSGKFSPSLLQDCTAPIAEPETDSNENISDSTLVIYTPRDVAQKPKLMRVKSLQSFSSYETFDDSGTNELYETSNKSSSESALNAIPSTFASNTGKQ